MDELVTEYAKKLRRIYHMRLAGDYTFEGVLAEFLMKVAALPSQTPAMRPPPDNSWLKTTGYPEIQRGL